MSNNINKKNTILFTSKEPWRKVSSRVDRVAAVKPKTDPDCEDGEADEERDQLSADLGKNMMVMCMVGLRRSTNLMFAYTIALIMVT